MISKEFVIGKFFWSQIKFTGFDDDYLSKATIWDLFDEWYDEVDRPKWPRPTEGEVMWALISKAGVSIGDRGQVCGIRRKKEDRYAYFVRKYLTPAPVHKRLRSSEIFGRYDLWCKARGFNRVDGRTRIVRLVFNTYPKVKVVRPNNVVTFVGLRFKDDDDY